jgi:hypothetical protein
LLLPPGFRWAQPKPAATAATVPVARCAIALYPFSRPAARTVGVNGFKELILRESALLR